LCRATETQSIPKRIGIKFKSLKTITVKNNLVDIAIVQKNESFTQKYSRLRRLLSVKGLVICCYFDWSGSILQIRTNMIKVGSKSWLLPCSSNITLSLLTFIHCFCFVYLSLLYFCLHHRNICSSPPPPLLSPLKSTLESGLPGTDRDSPGQRNGFILVLDDTFDFETPY
jgi:hypothetical protein